MVQDGLATDEAFPFDFCELKHLVKAVLVVQVELASAQLDHYVISFEWDAANWTVTTLHELELAPGVWFLAALFDKFLQSLILLITGPFFVLGAITVVLFQEVSIL